MNRIVKTADGSDTLLSNQFGETYHSTFGAVQESLHVFINAGLHSLGRKNIHLLEVGFGTGLNCLLTYSESKDRDLTIQYTALEKFPVEEETWKQLNYAGEFSTADREFFERLHLAPWNEPVVVYPSFTLHKILADLTCFNFRQLADVDLVYFDAFSPETQPEMWNAEVFTTIFERMNEGGMLVTYCAKGAVRRLLQQAGFKTERLAGPPGKREMLRATKSTK
ncbi:MAG: tRNA (5-methylaminomethyl-2-thiouridine)(34)-methyltransferase MnmD [Marinilabiliales bacterium]|nr:tRNA (5-methylaminomethyl-2-thiouridine)(34)-methyltransferase MnmD [Marinilabiliales bacterium]